eukprot:INCI4836.1.p1 GENE.INCI4836.1~~INCI4836.1.p1  ORF type:complete len:738 (-),score=111.64 INCI4836.1:795-2924(-)
MSTQLPTECGEGGLAAQIIALIDAAPAAEATAPLVKAIRARCSQQLQQQQQQQQQIHESENAGLCDCTQTKLTSRIVAELNGGEAKASFALAGAATLGPQGFSTSLQDDLAVSIVQAKYDALRKLAGDVVLLEHRRKELAAARNQLECSPNVCKNEVLQRVERMLTQVSTALRDARDGLDQNQSSLTTAQLSMLYSNSLAQKQLAALLAKNSQCRHRHKGTHSVAAVRLSPFVLADEATSDGSLRQLENLQAALRSDADAQSPLARVPSRALGSNNKTPGAKANHVHTDQVLRQPILSPGKRAHSSPLHRSAASASVSPTRIRRVASSSSLGSRGSRSSVTSLNASPATVVVTSDDGTGTPIDNSNPYFHYSESIRYAVALLGWANAARPIVARAVSKWIGLQPVSSSSSRLNSPSAHGYPAQTAANLAIAQGLPPPHFDVHVRSWESLLRRGFSHLRGDFSRCVDALAVDVCFSNVAEMVAFLEAIREDDEQCEITGTGLTLSNALRDRIRLLHRTRSEREMACEAMSYDAGVVNPVAGVFDDPFMGDDGSTDHFAGDSSFMFLRVSQCSVLVALRLHVTPIDCGESRATRRLSLAAGLGDPLLRRPLLADDLSIKVLRHFVPLAFVLEYLCFNVCKDSPCAHWCLLLHCFCGSPTAEGMRLLCSGFYRVTFGPFRSASVESDSSSHYAGAGAWQMERGTATVGRRAR